jgi:predicted GTPase
MKKPKDDPIHVTTEAVVQTYTSASTIFQGLLKEVRELSRKKPDATMSLAKVKLINRVLTDLLGFLKSEPEGKYLEELDNETLPQVSDALLVMVQFDTALTKFSNRYQTYDGIMRMHSWVTQESLASKKGK